ncbi:hypothetical protein [Actinoallomurus acanthiterrae]
MDDAAAVRVFLDRNGLPERIQIVSDWRDRVGPEKLGDAVVYAFRAAVDNRVAVWADALREAGWYDKANRLKRYLSSPASSMPSDKLPAAFHRDKKETVPRTLEDLTEEFIQAADKISEAPALPGSVRRKSTGWSIGRKACLVLDANGIKSCVIDLQWASARSGSEVSKALGEALAAARSSLAKNLSTRYSVAGLEDLLGSAMDLLADPRRLVEE